MIVNYQKPIKIDKRIKRYIDIYEHKHLLEREK